MGEAGQNRPSDSCCELKKLLVSDPLTLLRPVRDDRKNVDTWDVIVLKKVNYDGSELGVWGCNEGSCAGYDVM